MCQKGTCEELGTWENVSFLSEVVGDEEVVVAEAVNCFANEILIFLMNDFGPVE